MPALPEFVLLRALVYSWTPPDNADPQAVDKLAAFLARTRRQCRSNAGGASRSGAGDHQPPATSHRLHDRLAPPTQIGRSDALWKSWKFSAGGFSRISPGSRRPRSDHMWRDVFTVTNKDAVLEMLGTFKVEDLAQLTRAIRRGDGEALFDHFARTRAIPPAALSKSARIHRRPISASASSRPAGRTAAAALTRSPKIIRFFVSSLIFFRPCFAGRSGLR